MTAAFTLPAQTALAVALQWQPGDEVRVGRLAMRGRQVLFEFDRAFLADGLDISPFRLPRQPGVLQAGDPAFESLPGVFNDSLPDGWGRLLLDRAARRAGITPAALPPLDRLAHVGCAGMGALVYRPELGVAPAGRGIDLDDVDREVREVLAGSAGDVLEHLRQLGGSPQGARPKALVQLGPGDKLSDAAGHLGADWQPFLVKFAADGDFADAGPVEWAYAQMAAAAGVELPVTRLLPSRTGHGYFAAQRFDRAGPARLHVATASGLLHADHRLPSLDYLDLARLTVRLCRDHRQGEALVQRMVFNVLAHNRDDHAKQFSYVMTRDGAWRLSPAYDLMFSAGLGGEHSTAVAGEGRAPRWPHVQQVAEVAGMSPANLRRVVEQTRAAVERWPEFAAAAGVTAATTAEISAELGRVASAWR